MSLHALRPARARLIIAAAVLALAGLLLATIPGRPARAAAAHPGRSAAMADGGGGTKPTIVLEHGARADSGSWNAVTVLLQADGYTVDAPPNPLRGLSYDSSYLADFVSTLVGPIVLVGHSYGGMVITNAATGNPNVKALVTTTPSSPPRPTRCLG